MHAAKPGKAKPVIKGNGESPRGQDKLIKFVTRTTGELRSFAMFLVLIAMHLYPSALNTFVLSAQISETPIVSDGESERIQTTARDMLLLVISYAFGQGAAKARKSDGSDSKKDG